jgi:hypothetical protein
MELKLSKTLDEPELKIAVRHHAVAPEQKEVMPAISLLCESGNGARIRSK